MVLAWSPPQLSGVPVTDPLAWARRMLLRPLPIFAGLMLPIILLDLIALCLRWPDMRWQAAAVAVLGGFTGLAVLSARYLSQMRMTCLAAVGMAAANTVLAAVGSLAVAPGTIDSRAYWVGGVIGIVVAAIHFTRGPVSGLAALALDLAALTAGLRVRGAAASRAYGRPSWQARLSAWVAVAMQAAFRSLSSRTEPRLAEYGERVRLPAWAEVISRVDNAALETAARGGTVLEEVVWARRRALPRGRPPCWPMPPSATTCRHRAS